MMEVEHNYNPLYNSSWRHDKVGGGKSRQTRDGGRGMNEKWKNFRNKYACLRKEIVTRSGDTGGKKAIFIMAGNTRKSPGN